MMMVQVRTSIGRAWSGTAGQAMAAMLTAGVLAGPAAAVTRYVDANLASGANNGTSWADAYQGPGGLATAITAALSGDQVWVADGTYRPTLTTTRTISFNLKTGVQVYGGFAGGESTLGERDVAANIAILTGDLVGNDVPDSFTNNADNSHHVVNGAGATSTAVLDGFTITGGNANGATAQDFDKGGGLVFLSASNGSVRNCIIKWNRCTFGGGAVYIRQSSPSFVDTVMRNNIGGSFGGAIDMANFCNPSFNRVQFISNSAARAGGVEVFGSSQPTIYNCLFRNNSATGSGGGGALWIGSSSIAALRDCTIANNSATMTVGGVLNSASTTTMHNCIIWGNTGPGGTTVGQQVSGGTNTVTYSAVQNGFAGTGNISSTPLFVNSATGDLRLGAGSPCIDAGINAQVPVSVSFDLDLNPRKVDDPSTADTGSGTPPLVDMGAYEFQPPPAQPCPPDISGDGQVNVDDLVALIAVWGPCPPPCDADVAPPGGDGVINVDDLVVLIAGWGPCR